MRLEIQILFFVNRTLTTALATVVITNAFKVCLPEYQCQFLLPMFLYQFHSHFPRLINLEFVTMCDLLILVQTRDTNYEIHYNFSKVYFPLNLHCIVWYPILRPPVQTREHHQTCLSSSMLILHFISLNQIITEPIE